MICILYMPPVQSQHGGRIAELPSSFGAFYPPGPSAPRPSVRPSFRGVPCFEKMSPFQIRSDQGLGQKDASSWQTPVREKIICTTRNHSGCASPKSPDMFDAVIILVLSKFRVCSRICPKDGKWGYPCTLQTGFGSSTNFILRLFYRVSLPWAWVMGMDIASKEKWSQHNILYYNII